mgnify:CR=1 FL=1
MKCLQCFKETSNPKFCSKSCSATFNNLKAPKRQLEGVCKKCNNSITKSRKYCKSCWLALRKDSFSSLQEKSLGDFQDKRKYQINSEIRNFSRKIYSESTKPKHCISCGYSKHYEVCHIKAISSFDSASTLAEINSLDNLIALCRNCHWEFDKGILKFPMPTNLT